MRGLYAFLRDAGSAILDAVLPPRATQRLLKETPRGYFISLCGSNRRIEDGIESLLPYRDPRVTALVWELKYRNDPLALRLAAETLAHPLAAYAEDCIGTPLLIPVPMHPERLRERRHNQTETLCRALPAEVRSRYEYAPRALGRSRAGAPQQKLKRKERLENMKGAMGANDPAAIRGRVCVVLDDVTTTGATLREARRALLAAGAAQVHCMALAS